MPQDLEVFSGDEVHRALHHGAVNVRVDGDGARAKAQLHMVVIARTPGVSEFKARAADEWKDLHRRRHQDLELTRAAEGAEVFSAVVAAFAHALQARPRFVKIGA